MKILLLDSVHPVLIQLFEDKGWEVHLDENASRDQIRAKLNQYGGLIVRSRLVLDAELLSFGKRLKFIGRPGAGMENIDVDYCKAHGIEVFRSPEGNRDAVAEHAVAMLLCLLNKIDLANQSVKKGEWNRKAFWGTQLKGLTVGIYGYGVMGKALAKRLSGFGVQVIGYDKYLKDFSDEWISQVDEATFFQQSDVFTLHTPLTKETVGMVNSFFLSQFKKNIYLINTARGQSLVLADLVKALESGKVKGACLDVLEIEKTTFEATVAEQANEALTYLFQSNKVLLSPHVAGWTKESNVSIAKELALKIISTF